MLRYVYYLLIKINQNCWDTTKIIWISQRKRSALYDFAIWSRNFIPGIIQENWDARVKHRRVIRADG